MGNRLVVAGWVGLLAFSTGLVCPAGAAPISRAGVKSKTFEQQIHQMNSFQMDCLNLIRPPEFSMRLVETSQAPKPGLFFVRLVGKAESGVRVRFRADTVDLILPGGGRKKYDYQLRQSEIATGKDGRFAFTILISASDTVVIPLVFEQEIDQRYDLSVGIDAEGKVRKALLDPVVDFSLRSRLCPRDRLIFSFGSAFIGGEQDFQSFGGSLSHGSSSEAMSLHYDWNRSPVSGIRFQARSASALIASSSRFQSDLSAAIFSVGLHDNRRSADWIWPVRETMWYPYWRYGLQMHRFPINRLRKADQTELENVQTINASFGAGADLYWSSRWGLGFSLELQHPLSLNAGMAGRGMFSASLSLFRGLGRTFFTGVNFSMQSLGVSYERDDSFDARGQARFTTQSAELSLGSLF